MIDLSFLHKFTKGNKTKMRRYIKLYLSVAPEMLQKMGQNIQQQDWKGLAVNAHSFKSQVEYMGIHTLKAVLINLEKSAKSGEPQHVVPLFKEVIQLHQQAKELLKRELATL